MQRKLVAMCRLCQHQAERYPPTSGFAITPTIGTSRETAVKICIDVARNRLVAPGQEVRGTHRWEALTVALLASAQGQPLTQQVLMAELHRRGQRAPLDRTGVRRLMNSLERMLDSVLGEGAFAAHLRFGPRHLTVGPWALVSGESVQWEVVDHSGRPQAVPEDRPSEWISPGAARLARTCPSPRLTCRWPEDGAGALAPAELLFRADALFLSGHMDEASRLLLAACTSRWISAEGWCLLQLRLARLCKRRGQFDEAEDHIARVMPVCTRPGFPDPGLAAMGRFLLRRIRYNRSPTDFESLGLERLFNEASPLPDLRPLAEAENLEALLLRRRAGQAAAGGHVEMARSLLHEAHDRMASALYWAASARDYENCHNFAFDIGLISSSLHDRGDDAAAVAAFRAYRLGLQLREDFFVGRDSMWAHICVGELWLGLPDRRAEFESELAFELPGLCTAEFYLNAVNEAAALGDARQLALCCINLWRFAQQEAPEAVAEPLLRTARERLSSVLQLQPELIETLIDDAPNVLHALGQRTALTRTAPTAATRAA